jgi:hypothetical protein
MPGLLIDNKIYSVKDVKTLAPNEEAWNFLSHGQSRASLMGTSYRPQYKIAHKTIADDPERVIESVGPVDGWGGVRDSVEDWHKRGVSGTQLITGFDGSTVCTADLVRFIGWHAGAKDADANPRSWGHEMKEKPGGGVYRSTLEGFVKVTLFDTFAIGVQQQCPVRYINNKPNSRFARNHGADLIGVFGHRDVTGSRGYWDPGDIVFDMLAAAGFERFDFYAGQDLDVWAKRQEWLRELGLYHGAIDGIAGPGTTAALKQVGFPGGIFARWRDCAELPPMPPGWTRP